MRYKPYGLTEADLKEPWDDLIPERVQKIIELHHKNFVQYEWTQEDRNERMFEYKKTLRPDTYKFTIEAIYRVRDPSDTSKEYYFYQKKGKVLNNNDDPEYSNSLTYGYAIEPIHELRYNPKAKRKEPHKIVDNPTYFFKWNPKEVKKLLSESEIPCTNFYLGICANKSNSNSFSMASNVMGVRFFEDWLYGNFNTLMLLNKAGVMSPEVSTLSMAGEAKDRFKEELLKKIAAVSSPTRQPEDANTNNKKVKGD